MASVNVAKRNIVSYSTWVRWVVSTNIMQFNEFEYHFIWTFTFVLSWVLAKWYLENVLELWLLPLQWVLNWQVFNIYQNNSIIRTTESLTFKMSSTSTVGINTCRRLQCDKGQESTVHQASFKMEIHLFSGESRLYSPVWPRLFPILTQNVATANSMLISSRCAVGRLCCQIC